MWFLAIPAMIRTGVSMVPPVLWKYIIIAVAVLAVFLYGNARGKRIARAECEAAAQRAQKAADKQDTQAEREVSAQNAKVTEELTNQKKVDDAIIANLNRELARRPAGSKCEYDKSTADPD